MDWFETLFGFAETDAASVTDQLEVDGCELRSRVNGASYQVGRLETPTLGDLRQRIASLDASPRPTQVCSIVGDADALHADAANAGALFLTKLGGGVFGNDTAWIRDAMERAFGLAGDWGLDVRVVHFGAVDERFGRVTSR